MTRAHPLPSVAASLVLLAGVTACSSQPAVCDDVDALRGSLANLRDLSVSKDGVDAVRAQLTDVGDQVDQLEADASSEFEPEVHAVTESTSTLEASLKTAKATPSAQTLATVADDLGSLSSAVNALGAAVASACD